MKIDCLAIDTGKHTHRAEDKRPSSGENCQDWKNLYIAPVISNDGI